MTRRNKVSKICIRNTSGRSTCAELSVEGNNFNYEKTYHSHAAAGGCPGADFVHHRCGETGADNDHHDNVDDEKGGNANDYAGNDDSLVRQLLDAFA